jgi:VWFA-related protein
MATAPSHLLAQAKPTSVYVSVVDGKGAPVTTALTPADFSVREDGVAREVLSVEPATDPLTVALLIDDTQAIGGGYTQMIREGAQRFIKALAGKGDIALITFGDRPTIVVDYTPEQKRLLDATARIFPRPGAGAYFMDAVLEICQGFRARKPERPVIAALMLENDHEFSNTFYKQVLDALDETGAALHVIAVGTPAAPSTDEIRNRNQVLSMGTSQSGGRRDQVLAETAIPGAMAELGDELAHQYKVTYARPDTLIPPGKIDISVTRPGLKARARTKAPGK